MPRLTETLIAQYIKHNIYRGLHTYSGPATYVVGVSDPNRVENIINMSNSVNTLFYLEDSVKILDPNIIGYNNSPILYNPPIDYANVNQVFIHNPNAFDADGDSLVFRLIPPLQSRGNPVGNYRYPNQISPGPDNNFTIDSRNGEIRWDVPKQQGIYNIAFIVEEYRNGILFGTVIRDMQIFVEATNNKPPVLTIPDDICIVAGDTVEFNVSATDPDIGQLVTLIANGSSFSVASSPSVFTVGSAGNPISGHFYWATNCTHINKNEYQVLFKAEDNFNSPPLVDIKTLFIKVLPPAPQLQSVFNPSNGTVQLTWDSLYTCADNSKFLKFTVWRKTGCGTIIDSCSTDLASLGYTQIATTNNYYYNDNGLIPGNDYSYIVRAEFGDVSNAGVTINAFSSLPSEEECINYPISFPILYNVDVRSTDATNGIIYVEWSRPFAEELDTIINSGPYIINLYRAEGINGTNYTLIKSDTFNTYSDINDTSFLDTNLNTTNLAYTYNVQLIVRGGDTLGFTNPASSVYLTTTPNFKSADLSWSYQVPWQNDTFVVYRKDPSTLTYVIIDTITTTSFKDTGLINDSLYCYKIEAIGKYNQAGLKEPLINFSQEACVIPIDTITPCSPTLVVTNYCNDDNLTKNEYINYLVWNYNTDCDTSVIVQTKIYYKAPNTSSFVLLDSFGKIDILAYTHILDLSVAGCYYIQTIGKSGKTNVSNTVCVDDCPVYNLPNAFTPNNDGSNDLFTPILPYGGVAKIDFKVFNRWGNLVFETNDPNINWDGTDSKNGSVLNTAVYYYVCDVYYQTSNGLQKLSTPLSGYIHLFRE
ncbi:MAG: gliding motility-associated C-terminal domain-containing protein [Chitinophagales bacterium]